MPDADARNLAPSDKKLRAVSAKLALLRWLWAGQWRSSPGRTLTAVVAIAIGVALALAIHLVNRSALNEFGNAIAVVNGDAQLQLRGTVAGFDESIYAQVAQSEGLAAFSPVIETEVLLQRAPRPQTDTAQSTRPALALQDQTDPPADRTGTASQTAGLAASAQASQRLTLIGLDVMRAASTTPALLPRPSTNGQRAAGSASDLFADDAIFLSPASLRALDARIGDPIVLIAGLAHIPLRIAGDIPGAGRQQLAIMDIGAAQWHLNWLGRLSRIDLRLQAGIDTTQWAQKLQATLPRDLRVVSPDNSQQRMSNLSRAYRVNLNVLALVALFTGGFIVYSTMSLAMQRQLPELALIGTLGGSRRLLAGVIAGQGLVLGTLGAALGVAAGFGLAGALLALLGGDLGGGYFQGERPGLVIAPAAVALFAALGIAVGLLGGAMAARRLSRMEPARALRAGRLEQRLRRGHGLAGSGLLFALGCVLLALPPIMDLPLAAYLAIVCWLLAGIVFVPVLTSSLGRLLQDRDIAWRQASAWLAIQRIAGAPNSAAAALSGVVASVALASAMAIMVHSFRDSVDRWLDVVLPADLYGRAPVGSAQGALPMQLQSQIPAVTGVQRVDFLRILDLNLDPQRPAVTLLARDLDIADPARQLPVTGAVLKAPEGMVPIYVSEAMVDLYGFRPGTSVSLPLQLQGPEAPQFFVAAVWRDYARQHGTITINRAQWRALTGDSSANNVALWLAPGHNPETVIGRLRAQIPALSSLEFSSTREIRQLSLQIFDRSFALTYVLEAIAIIVGLFGVAATYAGEALARAREFGMLRHLGLSRAGITRMFAIESALLLSVGVLWGALIGIAIAMVLIHRVNPQSFHWTMDVAWPVPLLLGSAFMLIVMGIGSAILASRSATSTAPVRAVREDW